jgi:hypothetical protein
LEPAAVAVARDAAARAVAVVHKIGRIGQDEIDAAGVESGLQGVMEQKFTVWALCIEGSDLSRCARSAPFNAI